MAHWVRAVAGSCRGSGLNSQHPHGGAQLFVTPDPGNLMGSHVVHTHACKTFICNIKINLIKNCFQGYTNTQVKSFLFCFKVIFSFITSFSSEIAPVPAETELDKSWADESRHIPHRTTNYNHNTVPPRGLQNWGQGRAAFISALWTRLTQVTHTRAEPSGSLNTLLFIYPTS